MVGYDQRRCLMREGGSLPYQGPSPAPFLIGCALGSPSLTVCQEVSRVRSGFPMLGSVSMRLQIRLGVA